MKAVTKLTVRQIKQKYGKQRLRRVRGIKVTRKEKHQLKKMKRTVTKLESQISDFDKLHDLRRLFAQNQSLFASNSFFTALCLHVNK